MSAPMPPGGLRAESSLLDTKLSVPFRDLAMGLITGDRSGETARSLAARLSRLDNRIEVEDQAKIEHAAGKPLTIIACALFDAIDPNKADAKAAANPTLSPCRSHARSGSSGPPMFSPLPIDLMDRIRRPAAPAADPRYLH